MKIQINSLKALERLIGNDNELEMEIRNSVAQNFAKIYLKGIIQGWDITPFIKFIRSYIDDNYFTESLGKVYLKLDVIKKIEAAISEKFDSLIHRIIFKKIEEYTEEHVEKLIEEQFKEYTKRYFDKMVEVAAIEKINKLIK